MRRVIGMDIHRTFGEVVFWEDGRLRPAGRIGMTRSAPEGFGRTLSKDDEVVILRRSHRARGTASRPPAGD
jgi:transposase